MKTLYHLTNLHCANCAKKMEEDLAALPGVSVASINLMTGTLVVVSSGAAPDLQTVEGIVHRYESKVQVKQDAGQEAMEDEGRENHRKAGYRLLAGGAFFLLGLLIHYGVLPWAGWDVVFLGLSFAATGLGVITQAVSNLFRGRMFDETLLMSIATVGAILLKEYAEGAAVMLFYGVGEYFQERAVRHARASIRALVDLRPDAARVKRQGVWRQVPVEAVAVGETMLVKPGERIPLDGEVLSGEGSLDMAALTGESVPVAASAGDAVPSGAIVLGMALEIAVRQGYQQSTIKRMLDMVEHAAENKAKTEHFITRFAKIYTPMVVLAAVLLAAVPTLFFGGAWSVWAKRALTFLVISCPCALVISVPLGFFGGIGLASKHGILVKGSNYLEALAKVDTVVFDKTGTLTTGKFVLDHVTVLGDMQERDARDVAAAMEAQSLHPLAQAIAQAGDAARYPAEQIKEAAGLGVTAQTPLGQAVLGGRALMARHGVVLPQHTGHQVFLALNGQAVAGFQLRDDIKPHARESVAALKKLGVGALSVLTGDSAVKAEQAAHALGLTGYRAECMPEDKMAAVRDMRAHMPAGQGTLAFVGDGINDAPVLALSDVGIAMGALGADAAIEAADVVVMTDELLKIPQAVAIGQRTRRVVKQNIVFSLAVKVLVLLLGALGVANMWWAVFADVGVSLLACLNSLRLLYVKKL